MKITVLEYAQKDGKSPYQQWFDKLPAQAAAKVATATVRMELGNISAIKWFDGIGEYRIHWGPGLRIYLARDGEKLSCCWVAAINHLNVKISPGQKSDGPITGQEKHPSFSAKYKRSASTCH